MAAALAAFYARIPIGHVEAGLRTGDLSRPWPEEMNRKVIDAFADLLFAPTLSSRDSLIDEGIDPSRILVTGNTVIDALMQVGRRLDSDRALVIGLDDQFGFLDGGRKLVLVTGHRRESFGAPFEAFCMALRDIAERGDCEVLYPVHLNENVQKPVRKILGDVRGVHLIEPVSYLPFVYLMRRSHIVITDSGGIQEEAPALGKPVLVTRDVTERPEAVSAGTARLVGTRRLDIIAAASQLLTDRVAYERMSTASNPYGDGTASQKIAERLLNGRRV
jgi:UDP-N-acetylglucosamine 2-epimerase